MRTKFYLIATFFSCIIMFGMFIACDKHDVVSDNISGKTKEKSISAGEGYQRKMYVAKTLAKALTNEDLRTFLKKESQEMFDNEYDILYAVVKDKEISKGITFEDMLLSYAESKEHFKKVMEEEPLLTIYVPELTKWDANKWNTKEEVPVVAIRDEYQEKESTKVLAFDKMETPSYWDYHVEPDVPILVIKDNERVIINNGNGLRSANEDGEDLHILSTSKGNLEFSSEAFKNDGGKMTTRGGVVIINNPGYDDYYLNRGTFFNWFWDMHYDAWNKTPESPRDYIYYGISPKNNINKGAFKGNAINECINAFYIDNPQSLGYIVDSKRDNPYNWVEGRLEFFINVFFTGRDGKITSVRKGFTCKTSDLFGYNQKGELVSISYYFYENMIKIAPWDMNKYGDTWKIHVYEFDPGRQITKTVQVSSTFSSNFEADASVSIEIVKIGVKGGVGKSENKTNTVQITLTDTSDDLGEAILSFSDPIMIEDYRFLKDVMGEVALYNGISTGLASIQISPR